MNKYLISLSSLLLLWIGKKFGWAAEDFQNWIWASAVKRLWISGLTYQSETHQRDWEKPDSVSAAHSNLTAVWDCQSKVVLNARKCIQYVYELCGKRVAQRFYTTVYTLEYDMLYVMDVCMFVYIYVHLFLHIYLFNYSCESMYMNICYMYFMYHLS